MNRAFQCFMCGHEGIIIFDELEDNDAAREAAEVFDRMFGKASQSIACNRCGGWIEKRRKVESALFSIARKWEVADVKVRELIEANVRVKLNNRTREYAELICGRHNKETVWEPDFIELILRRPWALGEILKRYRLGVKTV